jgi:hypothetical protein
MAKGEIGTGWFFNRDKTSLDIFWLRDESLEESDNLPDVDILAREIVEDLEAALEQFREIVADLDSVLIPLTRRSIQSQEIASAKPEISAPSACRGWKRKPPPSYATCKRVKGSGVF